jgi:AcrR family transcriptional regulator
LSWAVKKINPRTWTTYSDYSFSSCYVSVVNIADITASQVRILESARGADTSITLIYRYFVDRDGLLARVLGDMYEAFRISFQTKVDAWVASNDSITLEDFAQLMPNPAEETKHARDFRLQVLATALENVELHVRIKAVTTDSYR